MEYLGLPFRLLCTRALRWPIEENMACDSEPRAYFFTPCFAFIGTSCSPCRTRNCKFDLILFWSFERLPYLLPSLIRVNRRFPLPYQISCWSVHHVVPNWRKTVNLEFRVSRTHPITDLGQIWHARVNPPDARFRLDRTCKFNILWWCHLALKTQTWTRCTITNLPLSNGIKNVYKFARLYGDIVSTNSTAQNRDGQTKNELSRSPPGRMQSLSSVIVANTDS